LAEASQRSRGRNRKKKHIKPFLFIQHQRITLSFQLRDPQGAISIVKPSRSM
jgi:hypothetical protein